MRKITITIEAITEFHNGDNYQFVPSLKIDIFDESGNNLFAHRCEDIKGQESHPNIVDAQTAATVFLASNVLKIGRAIIKEAGE